MKTKKKKKKKKKKHTIERKMQISKVDEVLFLVALGVLID
jgi:hypothetical protein